MNRLSLVVEGRSGRRWVQIEYAWDDKGGTLSVTCGVARYSCSARPGSELGAFALATMRTADGYPLLDYLAERVEQYGAVSRVAAEACASLVWAADA